MDINYQSIESILIGEVSARLSVGGRWLVWDNFDSQWVVYETWHGHTTGKVKYRGLSKKEALQVLINEEG